jgi:hypothetical protein
MANPSRGLVETIRVALLVILVIGLVGTLVELYLLRHTEGAWEILPLALIATALIALAWNGVRPGALAVRAVQIVMAACLVSGMIGVFLHFRVNVQYAMESNPSFSGWELYREAAFGATPMLAPGTMLQIGLVGLLFTFRHPNLGSHKRNDLYGER